MIIDGRAIAQDINFNTKQRVDKLMFQPLLVDIVVGEDPASLSYVRIKEKKAREAGLAFELQQLSATVNTEQVKEKIQDISQRKELTGLIIQLPLPNQLDTRAILDTIPSRVDVDLLNSQSAQAFYQGQSQLMPPTAAAILHILDSLPEDWSAQKFLVLGQGELVGKPIAYLLKQRGYQVTVADSATADVKLLISQSDCIISGVGKPSLLTGDQLKDGAIIIDAGTSEASGAIKGDADASVAAVAKYFTPVPGGVGPVTVAKLLQNVVIVAEDKL